MTTIRTGFHVIIGQHFTTWGSVDGKPSVRVAKNKPACQPHEVAVFIELDLPASLFKRPSLSATITVPEAAAPFVITPEVQQNIAQVVQEQLGITMSITAPEAPQQPET
jgi:hypothetical protein